MTQLTQERLDSILEKELMPIKHTLKTQNLIIAAVGGVMSLAMTIVITIMISQTSTMNSAVEKIGHQQGTLIQLEKQLDKVDK